MNRVVYRNLGDHQSLVVNYAVDVQGITGLRWYELRVDSARTPAAYQQGTFAPDTNHRWMASSAMDRRGDIAFGYSVSSASVFPSIRYTGRLATDPPGVLTVKEGSILEGSYSQIGTDRWGDYASMQVDPIDDCTFWFTTEYVGSHGPQTRVAAFRFSGCPASTFSVDVQPRQISFKRGESATMAISTAVLTATRSRSRCPSTACPGV
jgi:hypothetical protein